MNIEQLKAARDAISACIEMSDNTSVPENERVIWSQGTTAKPYIHIGMLKMKLPLLDNAIKAPSSQQYQLVASSSELESLKREAIQACLFDSTSSFGLSDKNIWDTHQIHEGASRMFDHLAPRIVLEWFAILPLEPTQEMIDDACLSTIDLQPEQAVVIYKAMIAASKGD